VRVYFDGLTSAGQVPAPYPEGSVLGATNGEFEFYAVEPSTPQPGVNHPVSQFVRPSEAAISVQLDVPAGLSNVSMSHTSVMPGFLMEQATTTGTTHSYDALALHQDFPNLDVSDGDGNAGVDTVTLSYLLSGTNTQGKTQYFARQLLLQGEELLALPDPVLFADGFEQKP